MSDSKVQHTSVIGVDGLLGVAFVVLKLAKIGAVASWPWLWVLSPFWIPLALFLGAVIGIVLWFAVK